MKEPWTVTRQTLFTPRQCKEGRTKLVLTGEEALKVVAVLDLRENSSSGSLPGKGCDRVRFSP